MSFEILTILPFEREMKALAKKYPSIKKDYADLLAHLENNPTQGTPLGQDCYKKRMSIASKGKGKRGGASIITCVKVIKATVLSLAYTIKMKFQIIQMRPYEQG